MPQPPFDRQQGPRIALPLHPRARRKPINRKAAAAFIVAAIVLMSLGGIWFANKFGETTSTDPNLIIHTTRQMLRIEVPETLRPRLYIRRPDEFTMVVYAAKDGEACLAIAGGDRSWSGHRDHRISTVLHDTLARYLPQFQTDRRTGSEIVDVSIGGSTQQVVKAKAIRTDDRAACRTLDLEKLVTDKGDVAFHLLATADGLSDSQIDRVLASLK